MRVSCRVMLAGFAARETTQTPEKYKSPMLQYHTVPVTAFQQNCSLVWCDQTMDEAVIDPGGDLEQIEWEVERLGLNLKAIWITHPEPPS